MTIELFGLPAAGKTTYRIAKTENGGAQYISLGSLFHAILWSKVFALLHPIRAIRLVALIMRESNSWQSFKYKFTNFYLYRVARQQKAQMSRHSGTVIVDEGMHQNILSLFDRELAIADIAHYFSLVLPPNELMIIEVSEDVRTSRITTRGHGAREFRGEAYAQKWKELQYRNYMLCKKYLLEHRFSYPVTVTSGTVDSSPTVHEINH